MKKLHFGGILVSLLFSINSFQVLAMETETTYPWYQAYKNPVIREKVAKSWEETKKFVMQNKGKLALGTVALLMVYLGYRTEKLRRETVPIFMKHYIKIDDNMPFGDRQGLLILADAYLRAGKTLNDETKVSFDQKMRKSYEKLFTPLEKRYPTLKEALDEMLRGKPS